MEGAYSISGNVRAIFRILAYGSLALMIIVLGYLLVTLLTQGIGVIGSSLVEVEFPPPSISAIHAKPITYLYASSLVFMYTELELIRDRVTRLRISTLQLYKFFAFIAAAIAFFELAYNLIFWSGGLAAQAILGHLNPDIIANPFPDLTHPINVVFASKIAAMVFLAGAYIFYYISKIQDYKMMGRISSPAPVEKQ